MTSLNEISVPRDVASRLDAFSNNYTNDANTWLLARRSFTPNHLWMVAIAWLGLTGATTFALMDLGVSQILVMVIQGGVNFVLLAFLYMIGRRRARTLGLVAADRTLRPARRRGERYAA